MRIPRSDRRRRAALCGAALALLAAAPLASALSTDRDQSMQIDADYQKSLLATSTNNQPGITHLTGNVKMVQGSLKAHGDEATVYQHAKDAKDAQGNDISGGVQRVILIGKGKLAHMEQLQDNDGGLATADADKIDYNADTSIAELTGNVTVVQHGHGTFTGTHMLYNTNTGEMESGDSSGQHRVTMVMEPKAKPAAPAAATPATTTPKPAAAATPAKKKKNGKTAVPATTPMPATSPAPATPPPTGNGNGTP
jgi:lipopolysaccharide export system protein LptA